MIIGPMLHFYFGLQTALHNHTKATSSEMTHLRAEIEFYELTDDSALILNFQLKWQFAN